MQSIAIVEFARQVIFVHGGRAHDEAVLHADLCERVGESRIARTWRDVGEAIADLMEPKLH